jgi:hypothetical protein
MVITITSFSILSSRKAPASYSRPGPHPRLHAAAQV